MPSSPEISIVVPAYNAARFLSETLDSVLAQSFTNWELIVIDDGSRDDTRSIAEAYAAQDARVCVVSRANTGVSLARNEGFARSDPRAPFVIFLDADDLWEPSMLTLLRDTLNQNPDAVAAYGVARQIDGQGAFVEPGVLEDHQRYRWGVEGNAIVRWPAEWMTTFAVEAVQERIITCGTVLLRRAALAPSGLFDPALRMWEDWDFWLRVTRVGGMVFVDQPVLRYRRHDSNVSNATGELMAGEREIRRRLLTSLQDDPETLGDRPVRHGLLAALRGGEPREVPAVGCALRREIRSARIDCHGARHGSALHIPLLPRRPVIVIIQALPRRHRRPNTRSERRRSQGL